MATEKIIRSLKFKKNILGFKGRLSEHAYCLSKMKNGGARRKTGLGRINIRRGKILFKFLAENFCSGRSLATF